MWGSQLPMELSKLQLPNSDGYLLKWPEFWDVFTSSVHDQDIPNVSKFSYLKRMLRDLTAILGIPVTSDNYQLAVDTLKEHFGNQELIIEELYAKFQHLPTASNRILLVMLNIHLSL